MGRNVNRKIKAVSATCIGLQTLNARFVAAGVGGDIDRRRRRSSSVWGAGSRSPRARKSRASGTGNGNGKSAWIWIPMRLPRLGAMRVVSQRTEPPSLRMCASTTTRLTSCSPRPRPPSRAQRRRSSGPHALRHDTGGGGSRYCVWSPRARSGGAPGWRAKIGGRRSRPHRASRSGGGRTPSR